MNQYFGKHYVSKKGSYAVLQHGLYCPTYEGNMHD